MATHLNISPYKPVRRLTEGAVAWAVQRLTSLLLLVLIPLKIYSGYASVGKLPGNSFIRLLHQNPVVDGLVLFAVIFHVGYGLRVILIELGMAARAKLLFRVVTGVGLALFVGLMWAVT